MVDAMPDGAAVTLPVSWLREQMKQERSDGADIGDLTCEQAAEPLGRSPSTVREWCRAGEIHGAYRLRGREWRIPRSGLREFLEGQVTSRPQAFHRDQENDLSSWRRERN